MTAPAPALPSPFAWRSGRIAADLPGGHVRFTTRSPGPDDAPGLVARGRQVHGARVRVVADVSEIECPEPEADGQATALRGVACAVRVADCLPVALIAPEAVAALHAGWRGLAAGVLQEGVRALRGLGAGEIRAAIGPGARVCCYETGEEVHAAFAHLGPQVRAGTHADLAAVARAILEADDVLEIHDTGLCTMCAPAGLLWSHRRQGERAGRQEGVTWRS